MAQPNNRDYWRIIDDSAPAIGSFFRLPSTLLLEKPVMIVGFRDIDHDAPIIGEGADGILVSDLQDDVELFTGCSGGDRDGGFGL
jgi:hypothetical protein